MFFWVVVLTEVSLSLSLVFTAVVSVRDSLDMGSPHLASTVALAAPSETSWVPQRRDAAWLRVGKVRSERASVIISERTEQPPGAVFQSYWVIGLRSLSLRG